MITAVAQKQNTTLVVRGGASGPQLTIGNVAVTYCLKVWDAHTRQLVPWQVGLTEMAAKLKHCHPFLDMKRFPAVRITLSASRNGLTYPITFLLFRSGCVVQTGSRSTPDAQEETALLRWLIATHWGVPLYFANFVVTNICASAKLGHYVDLHGLHKYLTLEARSVYEPAQFPGLRFMVSTDSKTYKCTLYESGSFNVMGVTAASELALAQAIVPVLGQAFRDTPANIKLQKAHRAKNAQRDSDLRTLRQLTNLAQHAHQRMNTYQLLGDWAQHAHQQVGLTPVDEMGGDTPDTSWEFLMASIPPDIRTPLAASPAVG